MNLDIWRSLNETESLDVQTTNLWGETYLEKINENDFMKHAWLVWFTQYDLDLADLED